jgi:hypothetical protein
MAFETIPPAAPPSGAPGEPIKPPESQAAGSGIVGLEDALKGAEHTKNTQFSVSDLANASGGAGAPGSSVSVGQLVQGKIAVELMDSLIPGLLVLLFYKFGISLKRTDFQLTQGEKNTLAPMVEACLNQLMLNFNSPWTTLMVTVIFIYGGKAMEKGGIAAIDKKINASKPADPGKHEKPAAPPPKATKKGVEVGIHKPNPNSEDFSGATNDPTTSPGPTTWTEHDVTVIEKRRKRGRKDAIAWLEKNWIKKGGQI